MITDYKLLNEDNPITLSSRVRNYLNEGWKLYGSPNTTYSNSISRINYSQAMVWEEPKSEAD